MEQQLSEVALRLGGLVAIGRVPAPSHGRGHRNSGIRRRNLQIGDSANLLADELAQLHGAGALSGGASAQGYEQKPERSRARYLRLQQMPVNRLGRRRVPLSITRGLLGVLLVHMSTDVSPYLGFCSLATASSYVLTALRVRQAAFQSIGGVRGSRYLIEERRYS